MDRTTRATVLALIALGGAAVLFAMTIYPLDYGLVEGALLAGAFVLVAVIETVLDDTSF
ncbi:MAG: hypothetical protein ABEJ97_02640 [Halobellus sp.]